MEHVNPLPRQQDHIMYVECWSFEDSRYHQDYCNCICKGRSFHFIVHLVLNRFQPLAMKCLVLKILMTYQDQDHMIGIS